jgi:hypothetical protein
MATVLCTFTSGREPGRRHGEWLTEDSEIGQIELILPGNALRSFLPEPDNTQASQQQDADENEATDGGK